MRLDGEALELIKTRVDYNAHDLCEFGKMIRVQYVYNIFDDVMTRQGLAAEGRL
jgi:hypothetical protein